MTCIAQVSSRVVVSNRTSIINRICVDKFQSSTKIEALREELERMLSRDPSAKAIVFSQFTSMLDIIAFRLLQVWLRTCPAHISSTNPLFLSTAEVCTLSGKLFLRLFSGTRQTILRRPCGIWKLLWILAHCALCTGLRYH